MKKVFLSIIVLTLIHWSLPAPARDPKAIEQLQQTGQCIGCDLSFADLRNARLSFANLRNANLRNANLVNANLRNANLRNADLINASLQGVNLSGSDLFYADLRGANLTGANLDYAQLCHTILPDGSTSRQNCGRE